MAVAMYLLLLLCTGRSVVSTSNLKANPRVDNVIFSAAATSKQAQNPQTFLNYGTNVDGTSPSMVNTNTYNTAPGNNYVWKNQPKSAHGGQNVNSAIIDPHYVFGSPQSAPILTNLPIFPYNSPTSAPSFQQFPQPNHPGSILNPAYPHSLQPGNPYNSPFVFGQHSYFSSGVGGVGAGAISVGGGILGGSGGGLAPPPYGSYHNHNPTIYNPSPPQYQNQNPTDQRTQSHSTSISRWHSVRRNKWHITLMIVLAMTTMWCNT